MPGTVEGGYKVYHLNISRDPYFYKKIGSKGGKAPHREPRGFAAMDPMKVRAAGALGGRNGRRGKNKPKLPVENQEELDKLAEALQEEAAVISY